MEEKMCRIMGEKLAAASLTRNHQNFAALAKTWGEWMAQEQDEGHRKQANLWMGEAFLAECDRTANEEAGYKV